MFSASRSSNKLRVFLFVSVLGSSAFAGSEARAEDTKEAMDRFDRGVSLYQAGAFEGALLEFEAAYKVSGNFRVLFNIAVCKMESRDPAGALQAFRRYLSEGGERVDATKRATVDALIKKLELSVASLTVKSDAPPGTEVRIDDERVGTVPLAAPLTVRTGRRKVSIVSGAQRADKTIDVMSGESPSVELSLPTAQAQVANAARGDEPSKKSDSDGPGALWVPWTLAGAFGAAAVVTGVVAVGARNDAETARATFGAPQSDIDTPNKKATTFAAVTDVMLGATVIAAGIGTYFTIRWLSRPSPSERAANGAGKASSATSIRKVELAPAGAGLRLQGEF
jgi:hypothetical protein